MFGVLRPPESPDQMPTSPEAPAPRSMAPIPASQYNSREELLSYAKQWAAHQGYAIVIARSRFNRLWLKCDRGGQYENRRNLTPDQRKRKRGDSRLLGCPFKMLAIVRKDGVWRLQTEIAEHNHGPSEDLSLHPTLRRLTDAQTQKVNDMTDNGNSPAETLEELRKLWPEIKVLTRDIYNARKKYKTQKELAELAAGLPEEQPFEDPNGSFPGPTPNGRWEWVPDGEEVTSKNKKRKRRPPVEQQNLDPQLQTPTPSQQPLLFSPSQSASSQHFLHQLQEAQSSQANQNTRPATAAAAAAGGLESEDSAHTQARLQHHNSSFTNASDSRDVTNGHTDDDSAALLSPNRPSRHRQPFPSHQHPHARAAAVATETAIMSSSSPSTARPPEPVALGQSSVNGAGGVGHSLTNPAPKAAQSGQVLMSRIERMEKEQRDQKNMLARILGAVQGMQGGG